MIPSSPRRSGEPLWRLAVTSPDEASADAYAAALGEVATAVTAFETAPGSDWLVQGFTQGKPEFAMLEGMLALVALSLGQEEPALEAELLPDVDWLKLNQESFPPLRVGRYYVYGSHVEAPVPAGQIGLHIDAATAFGTGEHATTYGCLKALDYLARRGAPARVLDMGTGTGILGIAAAKTWHVPVLGCDIDRNSVKVAAENVHINGVQNLMRCVPSDGYTAEAVRAGGPYDLIFANILARPLAAMAPDLARHLAPGGVAILSGLLAHQERYVAAAHRNAGLCFRQRIARQGWHSLVFRKP